MRTTGLIALIGTSLFVAGIAAEAWDPPMIFAASSVLTPAQLKGEHHAVANDVHVKGYHYAFELHTDYGELKPLGLDTLNKRIQETAALEALNKASKTDVFIAAAGRSFGSMSDGIVHLAKDPEGTARGLKSGIKRFGINLGRKSKRAFQGADDDVEELDGELTADEAEDVANAAFGVNESARIWARKLDVDPYSRNPVLKKALIKIAQVDAAGLIATKVVVPIPTVVYATDMTADMVWSKDPEALLKANEAGLKAVGVSEKVAAEFFQNEEFTLTDQTRFVSALAAVKADGLAAGRSPVDRVTAMVQATCYTVGTTSLQSLIYDSSRYNKRNSCSVAHFSRTGTALGAGYACHCPLGRRDIYRPASGAAQPADAPV